MSNSIFRTRNPNEIIFQVEPEEGPEGLDWDNMSASIGDATEKHIASLSPSERLLWENFVVMPNGNVFQMTEDLGYSRREPDQTNFRENTLEDLEFLLRTAENEIEYLGEVTEVVKLAILPNKLPRYFALREEVARRKSNDALVRGELIPFEEWEQNPQMSKHWDTPATPKPRAKFIGSCEDKWMDYWPSCHPYEKQLAIILHMLDKSEAELVEPWIHTTKKGNKHKFEHYFQYLYWLTLQWKKLHVISGQFEKRLDILVTSVVGASDPDEVVIKFLTEEDSFYGATWRAEGLAQGAKDELVVLIRATANRLGLSTRETRKKKASDPQKELLKYRAFSKLGKDLWSKHRSKLRAHHWNLYRLLKGKIRLSCMISGIDVNHAYSNEIAQAFACTYQQAREVMFSRPYLSKADFWERTSVRPQPHSQKGQDAFRNVGKAYSEAVSRRDKRSFTRLPWELIRTQKEVGSEIPATDWELIWGEYNTRKAQLFEALQNSQE